MEDSKKNINDALATGDLTGSEEMRETFKENGIDLDAWIIYAEPKKQEAKSKEQAMVQKIAGLEKENERLKAQVKAWEAQDSYLKTEEIRLTALDKVLSQAKSQLKATYVSLLAEKKVFEEKVQSQQKESNRTSLFNINIRNQLTKVPRYAQAALIENALKIRIGYNKKNLKALLPPLDQNQSGLVSLHKGSDRKEFEISVQECLNSSEYGWLSQGESLLYPLSFTLSDDSDSYEGISLTTDYFNSLLGDSFLRYGCYFVNGLGVFTVSITAKGTYLTYQRGTKRQDTEKYAYYIPLIGERSVSVLKLSQLFNELATLKPERDRL
jgi:hypothetical protein